MKMNFSVLMSVYRKEDPRWLEASLSSIEKQTRLPTEVVIVEDGPLTPALEQVISDFGEHSTLPYKIVPLEKNVGLGEALSSGTKHCSYGWVARMDTDDIALPDRFERQLDYLEENPGVDVLGGWICEFSESPERCEKERKVPSSHNKIVKFAKYRNPMNHVTVVFRKSAVESVGGYLPMNGFEDYYLWMRMLKSGKRFANIPEVLVKVRTGEDMIRRRQGWRYAMDELVLEKAAYKMRFWSVSDLFRNFFIRFLPRLLPVFMVEKLYNLLRKI